MEKRTMPSQQSEKGRWPLALHLAWAVPAFAFITLSGATRPDPVADLPVPQEPTTDTVKVEVECIGNGHLGRVMIDPWYAELDMPTEGDPNNPEIMWVITGESPGVESILIQPKEEGEWPFTGTQHPGRGRGPAQAARSGKMLAHVPARGRRGEPANVRAGDRWSYNILVTCNDPQGDSTYVYVIDPDTGVGGGGA